MSQFQILVSDGLDDEGLALLRQGGEVRFKPQISPADLLVEIGDCDALVVRSRTRVTRAVIQATRFMPFPRAGSPGPPDCPGG